MNKHKIVTFTNNIARISITKDLGDIKENGKTIFINPDLSSCKGVSPELWTVENGKIVQLSNEKKEERLKVLHKPFIHKDELKELRLFNKRLKIALVINILITIALLMKL